jgi:hypothetical protein
MIRSGQPTQQVSVSEALTHQQTSQVQVTESEENERGARKKSKELSSNTTYIRLGTALRKPVGEPAVHREITDGRHSGI